MSIGNLFAAAGVGAAAALGKAIGDKLVASTADAIVGTSLDKVVSSLKAQWANGAGQSYVSKTQSVRVEPFALIDSRAVRLPYAKDIMNVAQRLFTAYYLLTVASDNTVGGVRVSRYLDKFSPDRDLNAATLQFLSAESYQHGLPRPGEASGLDRYSEFCSESNNPVSNTGEGASFGQSTAKVVNDVSNLAVGQIVDVTIQRDNQKAIVPVMIRLRTIGMEPVTLTELLSMTGQDTSSKSEWRKWRVGELTFWRDLVYGQYRIDAYRRAAMADKSGYFRKAHQRQNKGIIANLLTGQPSIGEATSICVITRDTQREVEAKLSGRFTDFETRQSIFEGGLMMLLIVVDPDMETITIYTRDIEDYGVFPIKDVRSVTQSSNGDLADIMKSYLVGQIPGRL